MRRLLLLLLLSLVGALVSAQWYSSDRFGIQLEQLEEDQRDEHIYTLLVERNRNLEQQVLYERNEQIALTELEYLDERLVRARRYEGDELIESEEYRYWSDGSLRRVTQQTQGDRSVDYRYRDGSLVEEWSTTPFATERMNYDASGRLVTRVLWEEGIETERESREYWGPAAGDPIRTITLLRDGRQTVRSYDRDGRLQGSSTAREGTVESSIVRTYRDGLLVEERDDQSSPPRLWMYEYDGETLVGERYLEEGILVRETRYDVPEYGRVEGIYNDGALAIRVFYREERRVREELIREGEVLRVRDFSTPGGNL